METFAKESKLKKLLRELKPTPVLCNKKKLLVFSHGCNSKFAVLGALLRDDLYMGALSLRVIIYIIDSIKRVTLKACG